MNELALITWVCSAPRAAVSHWWQLCFALASFNGQQAAEGACSGSLFQGGLIRRPWKRMGTGVKGWQVGGCGWGQHAIPAFSLGDPLPYTHPPHIQDSCTQGSCSLHCGTRGLAMSALVAADALGIKIFRRERSQGAVGKRRRSAALLGLYLERCRTTSSVEAAYLPAVSAPV